LNAQCLRVLDALHGTDNSRNRTVVSSVTVVEGDLRNIWFRGVTLGAAALLAGVMLLINFAFEAAGSIPDFENCGFIAGSAVVLFALYPTAAGLIAYKAARILSHRFANQENKILRIGKRIGFYGSGFYLFAGMCTVLAGPRSVSVTPAVFLLLVAYTYLCRVAGGIGASIAQYKAATLAFEGREN
jgi:hypothetical protein